MEVFIVKCCAEINQCKIGKLPNFVVKDLRYEQVRRRECQIGIIAQKLLPLLG